MSAGIVFLNSCSLRLGSLSLAGLAVGDDATATASARPGGARSLDGRRPDRRTVRDVPRELDRPLSQIYLSACEPLTLAATLPAAATTYSSASGVPAHPRHRRLEGLAEAFGVVEGTSPHLEVSITDFGHTLAAYPTRHG